LAGYFQKKTLRKAQSKALGGDAVQWLNTFESKAINLYGVYLSNEALLYPAGLGSELVHADEVVWAYGHKQDATMYFVIKIATHHYVVLRTANKKTFMIHFKKKAYADAFFEALQTQWPNVILGYHKELENVYKADPAGFVQAVQALDA
jgi:hypothetical protein